jgi:NADH dehydrogenase
MPEQLVTVFGGTGFLGRRIVRHLHDAGFAVRIASRHPDRAVGLFPDAGPRLQSVHGDINEDRSVAVAVGQAFAVVNAVSLYIQRGRDTFQSVHVNAAGRVARLTREAGAQRFLHISGIGADAESMSSYIRSRGQGEAAVLRAFPSATMLRPAVMFGPGDAFLTPLLLMLRRLPIFPVLGDGGTRVQPAYVEDVGEASARVLQAQSPHQIYELAGPRIYTYRALLRALAAAARNTPFLLPVPFALWHAIGYVAEFLPSPPITRNQVELMEDDSVATPGTPGFQVLRITPRAIEDAVPEVLQATGRWGVSDHRTR